MKYKKKVTPKVKQPYTKPITTIPGVSPTPVGLQQYANGGVTSADSLALYNNTKDLLNYYSTKNKYKNLGASSATDININKENLSAVKDMAERLKTPKKHPYTARRWNSGLTTAGNLLSGLTGIGSTQTDRLDPDYNFKLSDYYQNVDANKYKQRELANNIIDTDAPMALYDRRIKPTISYRFLNQNDEHTVISGTNPLYGDISNFYGYDPNKIKPWALRTAAEKNATRKDYVKSTTPVATTPITRANVNTIPMLSNRPAIRTNTKPSLPTRTTSSKVSPLAVKAKPIDTIKPEYQERIDNPSKYDNIAIVNPDGTKSTIKMMSFESDGKYYAAPTIFNDNGKLVEYSQDKAWKKALDTKNYKQFATEKEAQEYANNGYKKGTLLENYKFPTTNTITTNTPAVKESAEFIMLPSGTKVSRAAYEKQYGTKVMERDMGKNKKANGGLIDKVQLGLDAAQFVPVLGEAAYLASLPFTTYDVAKNISKGDYKQAGMDALGYIPGLKAFKYGVKGGKILDTTSKIAKQYNKVNKVVNTTNLVNDAAKMKKADGGELLGLKDIEDKDLSLVSKTGGFMLNDKPGVLTKSNFINASKYNYGGQLPKFDLGGETGAVNKSITTNKTVQPTNKYIPSENKQVKFAEELIQSPLFGERLKRQLADPNLSNFAVNKEQRKRGRNLADLTPFDSERRNIYNPQDYKKLGNKEEMAKMLEGTYGQYDPDNHAIYMNVSKKDSEYYPTLTHELSHASTRGNLTIKDKPYVPTFQGEEFNKLYKSQIEKMPGGSEMLKDFDDVAKEHNEYLKNTVIPELSKPTEIKARVDAARKALFENKLYDARKENFTPEHYEKMKNILDNQGVRELLNLFPKEEVIRMMNNIAYNKSGKSMSPMSDMQIAKHGGFIQKNKKQNSNWLDKI